MVVAVALGHSYLAFILAAIGWIVWRLVLAIIRGSHRGKSKWAITMLDAT